MTSISLGLIHLKWLPMDQFGVLEMKFNVKYTKRSNPWTAYYIRPYAFKEFMFDEWEVHFYAITPSLQPLYLTGLLTCWHIAKCTCYINLLGRRWIRDPSRFCKYTKLYILLLQFTSGAEALNNNLSFWFRSHGAVEGVAPGPPPGLACPSMSLFSSFPYLRLDNFRDPVIIIIYHRNVMNKDPLGGSQARMHTITTM